MAEEKKGGMRQQMPVVAAWVDELREAFGREFIDGQIQRGMRGEGTFWAQETGPDGVVRSVGSRAKGKRA